jgi:hypothetical protein
MDSEEGKVFLEFKGAGCIKGGGIDLKWMSSALKGNELSRRGMSSI